jgi:hypothetical protein
MNTPALRVAMRFRCGWRQHSEREMWVRIAQPVREVLRAGRGFVIWREFAAASRRRGDLGSAARRDLPAPIACSGAFIPNATIAARKRPGIAAVLAQPVGLIGSDRQ